MLHHLLHPTRWLYFGRKHAKYDGQQDRNNITEGIGIKKSVLTVICCAILIACMYWISPYRDASQATTVSAVFPATLNITDYVVLRGTTAEQARQNLYADGPARVSAVYVQPGDTVRKGQPLLLLEPLTAAEQSAGALYDEVQSAVSQINPAAAVTGDDALSDELAAIVSSAVVGVTQQATQVQSQQPYQLCSPIDGVVMSINCTQGQEISGILPCAAVSDLTNLAVKAQATENTIARIAEGMNCIITVDALTGEQGLDGTIESIMPYGRQTGTLVQTGDIKTDVWISLPNEDGTLRPGYSAQAKVVVNQKNGALVVPYDCVSQDDTQQEYVMIVSGGRAIKKYVTTGYELEEGIEVTAGLDADELLIHDPENIEHGDRVLICMEGSDDNA